MCADPIGHQSDRPLLLVPGRFLITFHQPASFLYFWSLLGFFFEPDNPRARVRDHLVYLFRTQNKPPTLRCPVPAGRPRRLRRRSRAVPPVGPTSGPPHAPWAVPSHRHFTMGFIPPSPFYPPLRKALPFHDGLPTPAALPPALRGGGLLGWLGGIQPHHSPPYHSPHAPPSPTV